MKQRNFIGKFLTANLKGENFNSDVRKAIIINTFSLVGIIAMLYFLINGIFSKGIIYIFTISIFLALTVTTVIMFHKYKNTTVTSIIIVSLMLFLEIALLTNLGESTTGLFWTYLFPILSLFMLGKKKGVIFTILLLIISIIIINLDIEGITVYPDDLHERFIITYIATSLLAFIFENIRSNTFNAFVFADKAKSEYLEETLQQKEEIQTQAELLEQKNIELQQLSIAASEADNSIIITDINTNIEWVNKGFTKMLQLTLEEFKSLCPTLVECTQNPDKIKQSIKEKRSITYYSHFILKDGSKIWLQSTATPVLNGKNEVVKLVIVETDITQQELAKQEIREKNEELNQQRDELIAKNEIILEKNEAIRQSIEYAVSIQKSIFPNLDNFNKHFENFILFQPKDIVSGDFYWLTETDENFFVAVVDCTGHGVPGAFMSILGSRLLDEIVNYKQISSPAKILFELNKQVIKSLHQNKTDTRDGMDLVLCRIKKTKSEEGYSEVVFSGAKRPLIYFDSLTNKIITIKGTRKDIGGFQSRYNKENFNDKPVNLQKNSVLYLTSDGFIDQHNQLRKRIGSKKLNDIIVKNALKDLKEQHQLLLKYKNEWQNSEMQTDDVTIWGIKIN